jgi:hypothetical protein
MRVALLLALLISSTAAYAGRSEAATNIGACYAEYYELTENLRAMRSWHVRWADFLEANPGYVPHDNIVSAAVQRDWVRIYDQRLWVVYYLATGDRTYVPWLIGQLEATRAAHLRMAADLYARPDAPLNATADGADGQMRQVANYDWRLAMVQRMLAHC